MQRRCRSLPPGVRLPLLAPAPPRPVQAVALGAAVQAGVYEGQVSDLMVMEVWQASLMRAFAAQLAREQGEEGTEPHDGDAWADEEEGWEDEASEAA